MFISLTLTIGAAPAEKQELAIVVVHKYVLKPGAVFLSPPRGNTSHKLRMIMIS